MLKTHAPARLLPALALLAANLHAAAAPALSVEESTTLPVPPAALWKLIGDFDGLPQWHPAVEASSITRGTDNAPGAVRTLSLKGGGQIDEELLAYDARQHSMTYRINRSPLPVSQYTSTVTIVPQGNGSRMIWKGEFQRTDAVDDAKAVGIFSGIYRAGFDSLRAKVEGGAVR